MKKDKELSRTYSPIVVDLWGGSPNPYAKCKVSVGRFLTQQQLFIVLGESDEAHIDLLRRGAHCAAKGETWEFQACGGSDLYRYDTPGFGAPSGGLGDIPEELKEIVMREFLRLYPLKGKRRSR